MECIINELKEKREKAIKAWPNCDFNCKKYCCNKTGCPYISRFPFWERRCFTKEVYEKIKNMRDKTGSYWTPNGCILPVKLRPLRCLEYNCKDENIN